MKILCICNHGNNRSAALARVIRMKNGDCLRTDKKYIKNFIKNEVICMGAHNMHEDSIKLLCDWANRVIDLSDEDERIQKLIKGMSKEKYTRLYVGGDSWGSSTHPELIALMKEKIKDLEQDWNIIAAGKKNE